jgi:hypothetical protein
MLCVHLKNYLHFRCMLQEFQNVNAIIRPEVIGDVYAYVNQHALYEFLYPSVRNAPIHLQKRVFTRTAYRRTLCGMLNYMAENDVNGNVYHYVAIRANTENKLFFEQLRTTEFTTPLTCACTTQNTNFIFEYEQGNKTIFFLATLTHASQILYMCTILRSNYEAYMGVSIDYKYLVDKMESYVQVHTPGVTTLVTRYTHLRSIPLQFSTFENFVSVLVKYSEMSQTPTVINNTHLQDFTTIQLMLAVQYVYNADSNSLNLLLDEVNFIDKLNQIVPPMSNLDF